MDGEAFKLLTPDELELIVVGSVDLDFGALEQAAAYEDQDDFNKDHEVVRYFWNWAQSLNDDGKKALLTFVTSSDRGATRFACLHK